MKIKTFNVQVRLDAVLISFEISATDLEYALTKAKNLTLSDTIFQRNVEWIDGEMKITGIYE